MPVWLSAGSRRPGHNALPVITVRVLSFLESPPGEVSFLIGFGLYLFGLSCAEQVDIVEMR